MHLQSHDSSIKNDKLKIFKCNFCERRTQTKFHLEQHIRRVHKNFEYRDSFECTKCHKILDSIHALKGHDKDVHNTELLICEICKEVRKGKKGLRSHMKLVHKIDTT